MEHLDAEREGFLEDSAARPDERTERRDTGQQLPGLLADLPDNQREVLRLKFQQDLSYREIADITDFSESNVGYLIHMGIKTLRERMLPTTGASS